MRNCGLLPKSGEDSGLCPGKQNDQRHLNVEREETEERKKSISHCLQKSIVSDEDKAAHLICCELSCGPDQPTTNHPRNKSSVYQVALTQQCSLCCSVPRCDAVSSSSSLCSVSLTQSSCHLPAHTQSDASFCLKTQQHGLYSTSENEQQ